MCPRYTACLRDIGRDGRADEGGSLENCWALLGSRGFESHSLRGAWGVAVFGVQRRRMLGAVHLTIDMERWPSPVEGARLLSE